MRIIERPSPNHGPRRDGLKPTLIVLHYTAMASAKAALERLCDREAEVSSHYLISKRGEVFQLVDEADRAWHAGAGSWRGEEDINSRSIGIELDNPGDCPFSEPLVAALEALLPGIMDRHGIAPEGVIGHSDMAPGRKVDPGPRFDWQRLVRQELAAPSGEASAAEAEVSEAAFMQAAQAAGYSADMPFEVLLEAVRLRYGPWRKGRLSHHDFAFRTIPER